MSLSILSKPWSKPAIAWIAALIPLHASLFGKDAPATAQGIEFFEKEIRPLFAENCYKCHSVNAKRLEAGLMLDSLASQLKGGDSGPAIVPGNAEKSLLVKAVRYEDFEMPPKGKLPAGKVDALVKWINMGAPWPEEPAPVANKERRGFDLEGRQEAFWLWQPVAKADPPKVNNVNWPKNAIDRHILAGLEKAGLQPSTDADRSALLRRLSFDLIGLPPSAEEVEAFLADKSEGALGKAVDKLLASPHFGERWGRHWLDLVRYAESRGHEFDNDAPNAHQYRDYVIRALNTDVPYDQFIREHIAGDLVKEPRLHPTAKFNESILGTGFWFLGEWVHSPVDIRKDEADRFDNMIDVMSKTFLGVTVACARCHDHKFDAISTADYYALTGFLQSSDYRQVRFESMEHNARIGKELAKVDRKYGGQVHKLLEKGGIQPPKPSKPLDDDAILLDYGNLPQGHFLQDGYIFGQQPRQRGEAFLVQGKTPQIRIAKHGKASSDPAWSGLVAITEGAIQNRDALAKIPKSGRTLRTPTFEVKHGSVSCLVEGAGHVVACVDSHRLVAGPLHKQTIKPIKANQRWVTLNLARYKGHRIHLEFTPSEKAQLSVRMVTQGLDTAGLAELDRRLADSDKVHIRYAQAAEDLLSGASFSEATKILQGWQQERSRVAKRIQLKSRVAPAMLDGTGEDDHILIRGNASKPGKIEPRHFLSAISGDSPMPIKAGSGRLELAAQINDPENPLTSRVIVNRIWHHLLGRGIVPTVDDFGVLGQRPTHPELLDHLATRFLADGRSLKGMIKYIVLSRTYQMSSQPDPKAMDADPKNLLWHHRPPKRLQGEAIRDSLLALSGELDRTLFGPPVPIHLTGFMDGRGRPKKNGPLDGAGRRSIYTAVRRNFLSPFMLAFDTPVPFSTMGRRNSSNVPAQALILLNDPLVVEMSSKWAGRALKEIPQRGSATTSKRVEWLYLSAFGRHPTAQEARVAQQYISSKATEYKVAAEDPGLWADFAHVLVNTKEFIFLR